MKKQTIKENPNEDIDWIFDDDNEDLSEEELIHMEQDAYLLDRRRLSR